MGIKAVNWISNTLILLDTSFSGKYILGYCSTNHLLDDEHKLARFHKLFYCYKRKVSSQLENVIHIRGLFMKGEHVFIS